jgi:hypothetical protein
MVSSYSPETGYLPRSNEYSDIPLSKPPTTYYRNPSALEIGGQMSVEMNVPSARETQYPAMGDASWQPQQQDQRRYELN